MYIKKISKTKIKMEIDKLNIMAILQKNVIIFFSQSDI